MNIVDQIVSIYAFNKDYALSLCESIPAGDFHQNEINGLLLNPPGWTLGHLALASAKVRRSFSDVLDIPNEWNVFDRTGPGDQSALPHADLLPNKSAIIIEYKRQHLELTAQLKTTDEYALLQPIKWFFESRFKNKLEMVNFMCCLHEAYHLGQLATWRRSMGITESALAKLKV
ncbi:MAG: DinB family protein [Bacteroidetes bacterium]|nr:DinB family protein [Bacteroidota bacterium]